MLSDDHPDRIQIAFDDHRLVANAGLLLPATLGLHLGLPPLVDRHLGLGDGPGQANTGDKMMTLVASALVGGYCIADADVLRAGGNALTLGGTLKAPSTLAGCLPVSVLKNALSSRFSASDDFCVARCPLSPSQLVFVPSMAISQQYLMPSFWFLGRGCFDLFGGVQVHPVAVDDVLYF